MSEPRTTRKQQGIGPLAWSSMAVAALILLVGFLWTWSDYKATAMHESWGQPGIRGDFYGGHISSAANLAATLFLFAAFSMQRRELQFQRLEMQDNREVAEKQAKVLGEQHEELKRQNEMTRYRDMVQLILSLCDQANKIRAGELAMVAPPSPEETRTIGLDRYNRRREDAVIHARELSRHVVRLAFLHVHNWQAPEFVGTNPAADLRQLVFSVCSWFGEEELEKMWKLAKAEAGGTKSPSGGAAA